ncbi:acyltransferase family protein [Pseudomonas sp. NPDC090233]|uniref:acyltransferase family protein n=1 Tax=Pseudomonas sp. NPDC090233 TaxID=3364479 RepID=UPI00383AFEC6
MTSILIRVKNRKMLNSIQILRAIAAWIVVLHHYLQVTYSTMPTDPISTALHRYGAIGVDLFFVISGFVIYLSASKQIVTPVTFAKHRIARIVPAYWIFTIITMALLIYMPGVIPLTLFDQELLVKSLLFIPTSNPSGIGYYPIMTVGWTLNYEMAFYGVFFTSLFLPRKLRIAGLVLGTLALNQLLPALGGAFKFYKNTIVFEFIFGVLIGLLHQRGALSAIKPWAALALAGAAFWIVLTSGQVSHSPLYSGVPCALLMIAALSQERFMKGMTTLNALGNWSYSTYLCHIPVLCLMLELQKRISLPPILTLFASLALIAAVSAFSFKVVESPIANRMKKKESAPRPAENRYETR